MNKAIDRVRRVLIIQSEMKHYRLPFFTGLSDALRQDNIELTVAYSNSNPIHASRNDRDDLAPPLGHYVEGRWFFKRFLYQPLWRQIFRSDLVIVGPEIKYLLNPVLLLMSAIGIKTVAFWGLGPNRHPDRSELSEMIKALFFTHVDWWFAYTASITDYLKERGMPADQITTVQNATDTTGLRRLLSNITEEERAKARIALTGSPDGRIGFYCGLIGSIKDIPLLLESARLVRRQIPDFHLIIVGDGPERSWLESEIIHDPWIHYVGFKNHEQSAIYYKISDVFLLAGTAGLAVVDSFAAGLPLLLTKLDTHPPEASYVTDGVNGAFTEHNSAAFAASIVEVFSKPEVMETLRAGALAAGHRYTIEAMIENYRLGIHRCLTRFATSAKSGRESLPT